MCLRTCVCMCYVVCVCARVHVCVCVCRSCTVRTHDMRDMRTGT